MNTSFTFDGDWEFNIELEKMCDVLTLSGRYAEDQYIKQERRKGIQIKVSDSIDYEPDPNDAQLKTINYIISNQEIILDALRDHIINIIFPLHKNYVDDEEIFFPKIKSTNDLSNVLGLDEILIHNEYKDSFAYSTYVFKYFSADTEHGQSVTLHKTRYISTGENFDFEGIEKDLGQKWKSFIDINRMAYEFLKNKELENQIPLSKYQKLKPWQIEINENLPSKLIHKNDLDLIKKYFESHKFNDRDLKYYLHLARNYPKTELYIKTLIENKKYNT